MRFLGVKNVRRNLVCSFATTESGLRELLQQQLTVLHFSGGGARLLPEGLDIPLQELERQKLGACAEYDVFYSDDEGVLYRYYASNKPEHVFVLSDKCNSNCLMCPSPASVRRQGHTARLDWLMEVIRYIPSDAPHFTITGGEPMLLARDAFPFFEALRSRFESAAFQLLTNGRIFAVGVYCDLLARTLPERTTIGIALHGAYAGTHDAITRAPGSFTQTVRGLRNLLARNMRLELRVVVSRLNADEVESIAQLIAQDFPATSSVKIMGLEMTGNAAVHSKKVWIPYYQAFEKSKAAVLTLLRAGIDVELYNFPLCSVASEFWPLCTKSISAHKVRFGEACESCPVQDACGGVFAGSLRFARPDMRPVADRYRLC